MALVTNSFHPRRPRPAGILRRRLILAAIARLSAELGHPPGCSALAAATGIPQGSLASHLQMLRRGGLVALGKGGIGFMLTERGRQRLMEVA
jgi:hypothetical protein